MKRLALLFLALALSACAGIDAPPPGNYAVVPLDGQAITPGVFSFEANGDAYTLRLWQLFPTATMVKPSQVPPSATPSPTNTATPTLTPTPTPTNTPNMPEWPTVTPTAETTDLPPLTPTPKTCELKANQAVKVRSKPSLTGTHTSTVWQNSDITVQQFVVTEETVNRVAYKYLWAKHAAGWSAVYDYKATEAMRWWFNWLSSSEVCQDVAGWDVSIPLPSPVPWQIKAGLHVLVGANAAPILANIGAFGTIKCLTSSWDICAAAKAAKPSITTVYRTLTLGDCPSNWDGPDSWWYLQRQSWAGINADYYEVMNECIPPSFEQMNAFSIRMMELAAADNRCLLLFSWAPGNPATLDWLKLKPALDYALTHPCRPNTYHGVALHQPGYAPPGLLRDPWVNSVWVSGAHRLVFTGLFAGKYTHGNPRLPIVISELGYDNGRKDDPNLASCNDLVLAIPVTNAAYQLDGIVTGWELWSVGGSGTVWVDRTDCIPLVAAVVH